MTPQNRKPLPGSESFESLGKTWHLAPIGATITEAYAAWCRMRTRRATDRDKALMTSEEYAEEKRQVKLLIDAGEYEWGPPPEMQGTGMSPGVFAMFASEPGKLHLLRLLLEPAHGELSDAEINAIAGNSEGGIKDAFDAVFFSACPWLRPVEATTETSANDASETPMHSEESSLLGATPTR